MHQPSTLVGCSLAVLLATASLNAQVEDNTGIGNLKRDWECEFPPPIQDVLIIGVCELNGSYYVSGRGDGTQRLIYEYDHNANFIRQFPAPPIAQATTNGVRDMATDGVNIIGGSALGILVFDTNGNAVNTIQAQNGAQAIMQPITGAAFAMLGNIFRGVAYDPAGNGGNGSLWVSNQDPAFSLDIFEIDLQGNILTTIIDQGWEAYGLALDPMTGNLWVNSFVDANNANGGPIFELDLTTGMPTGVQFPQGRAAFHGGLDGVVGGDQGSYPSHWDLVSINQANPDSASVYRVHLDPNVHGADQAFLEGNLNGAPFTRGDLGAFNALDTLNIQVNAGRNPINNGSLGWTIWNFTGDGLRDATTFNPFTASQFSELWAQSVFSNPASPFASIVPTSIGSPTSIVLPPGLFSGYDLIRIQAIYLDLSLAITNPFPFLATSEVFTYGFDDTSADIVVEANGANSFVGVLAGAPPPPNGFFRVISNNTHARNIVRVEFSFFEAPAGLMRNARFHVSEVDMGDFFDAGNSTDPFCRGTFRNGSDVTTGLAYDAMNNPPRSCNVTNPMPNSGWIGTNPDDPNIDYQTLTFRFTDFGPGETFEFDCDTDGVPTVDGAGHDGLVITVELDNGRVLEGSLRRDPLNANRAAWGFMAN